MWPLCVGGGGGAHVVSVCVGCINVANVCVGVYQCGHCVWGCTNVATVCGGVPMWPLCVWGGVGGGTNVATVCGGVPMWPLCVWGGGGVPMWPLCVWGCINVATGCGGVPMWPLCVGVYQCGHCVCGGGVGGGTNVATVCVGVYQCGNCVCGKAVLGVTKYQCNILDVRKAQYSRDNAWSTSTSHTWPSRGRICQPKWLTNSQPPNKTVRTLPKAKTNFNKQKNCPEIWPSSVL